MISTFSARGLIKSIPTAQDEITTWKHLLPAFVERCRSWSHKSTCEYIKNGAAPLSVKMDDNPICACGEGIELGSFVNMSQWTELRSVVTRAAFSPLFSASFFAKAGLGALKGEDDFESHMKDVEKQVTLNAPACAYCRKRAEQKVLRCSRCKEISYCGESCQNADWKRHKVNCRRNLRM